MKQVIFLIKASIIILVLATVLRAFGGFNYYNPIPVINVTPAALHRLVDTLLLGSIALGIVEVHRAIKERPLSPEDKEKKE